MQIVIFLGHLDVQILLLCAAASGCSTTVSSAAKRTCPATAVKALISTSLGQAGIIWRDRCNCKSPNSQKNCDKFTEKQNNRSAKYRETVCDRGQTGEGETWVESKERLFTAICAVRVQHHACQYALLNKFLYIYLSWQRKASLLRKRKSWQRGPKIELIFWPTAKFDNEMKIQYLYD